MCRARVSARQPAWRSSDNTLLTTSVLLALPSLWSDKEYSALPKSCRLTALPSARNKLNFNVFNDMQNPKQQLLQLQKSIINSDRIIFENALAIENIILHLSPCFKTNNLASLAACLLRGAAASHDAHCGFDVCLCFTTHLWKA